MQDKGPQKNQESQDDQNIRVQVVKHVKKFSLSTMKELPLRSKIVDRNNQLLDLSKYRPAKNDKDDKFDPKLDQKTEANASENTTQETILLMMENLRSMINEKTKEIDELKENLILLYDNLGTVVLTLTQLSNKCEKLELENCLLKKYFNNQSQQTQAITYSLQTLNTTNFSTTLRNIHQIPEDNSDSHLASSSYMPIFSSQADLPPLPFDDFLNEKRIITSPLSSPTKRVKSSSDSKDDLQASTKSYKKE
jgi:hypothetical protein